MSIARHHSEWLSLIEVSGPFVSIPVLMRVFPQGLENHDPEKFRALRLAYEEWEDNKEARSQTNPAIHGAWVRFVLTNVLGLPDETILEQQAIPQSLQASVPEHGEFLRPSLVIQNQGTHNPLLLVQTYPPNQDLDKQVTGKSWKASPGTRMMELLHSTGVRLGLVTNGERWMLVDAPKGETTGFASWYAAIWLEEPITLRAFTALLGADRFFNAPATDTLVAMLADSASNQQEVTEQLGYQVRRAVEVLIQSLDRADQDHDRSLLGTIPESQIYEAALTVMMRLVFLFSAEERGLLPLNDGLYAHNYAVSTMRDQLRKVADDWDESVLERRTDAWCRLLSTFRAVYGGMKHDRITLPAYGGHLFHPDRFPFLEGRKVGTTWKTCEADPLPVNNRTVLHLLNALQMLEVKMPGGQKAARRVSFRALDIEQIGHVYEGLLDHTAKRATEPMLGLIGTRDREPEVPLAKLEELLAKGDDRLIEFLREETGKSINALKNALKEEIELHNANRFQAVTTNESLLKRIVPFAGLVRDDTFGYPVVIPEGSVFVTAGTDRRSSGTHYTPRSLTEPIVRYTLEPLVYVGPAEGTPKEQWQLRSPKELLDLKICDMACGSGAFLVQACRYLSERLVEAWEQAEKNHPGTPGITPEGDASKGATGETLIPKDADERMAYAKRLVAQRTLYGVDINPLAAEMAKLSLWLLTLAKDKPFTFLDHTIRCGDSLLGIHDPRQLKNFSLNPNEQREWQFDELPLGELVDDAIKLRLKIESMQIHTVEDVAQQEQLLREAEERLAALKAAADYLVAAEMKSSPQSRSDDLDAAAVRFGQLHKTLSLSQISVDAGAAVGRRRFQWPLEFPEVVVARRGFDAFLGNPPFLGGTRISTSWGRDYIAFLKLAFANAGDRADLVAYFFQRAMQLLRPNGTAGLLATNSIGETDTNNASLKVAVGKGADLYRCNSNQQWPGDAGLCVAVVHLKVGTWNGERHLDDRRVDSISPLLTEGGSSRDPYSLRQEIVCGNGAKPNADGFLLDEAEAASVIDSEPSAHAVLVPYLSGDDIVNRTGSAPSRWTIYFGDVPLERAAKFRTPMSMVRERVLPERATATDRVKREKWWQFERHAKELMSALAALDRYFATPETAKHLIFAKIPAGVLPSNGCIAVATDRWDVFAVIQSSLHETWARRPGMSKLENRPRYNAGNCFDTFVFPSSAESLVELGANYEAVRSNFSRELSLGLTDIYNLFHAEGESKRQIRVLRDLHVQLDVAVTKAYGWEHSGLGHGFYETKQGIRFTISEKARREVLVRLLKLNHERYAEEVAQGLHDKKKSAKPRVTKTAVKVPEMADMGLFASLAYPATDADRAICAAALAVVEKSEGLNSMEHLDALLLTTHPEWCAAFLDDGDEKAMKRAMKAAPKELFVDDNTAINWKQSRNHLERHGAIRVVRGGAGQSLQLATDSKAVAAVKASLPTGTESVVTLALKAVERLTALKEDLAAASEEQKRFVLAIEHEEKVLQLVA